MRKIDAKNPYSLFEFVPRVCSTTHAREWRVKCLDCPGKVSRLLCTDSRVRYVIYAVRNAHFFDLECSFIGWARGKHSTTSVSTLETSIIETESMPGFKRKVLGVKDIILVHEGSLYDYLH